jgi:hypothetical protein
MHPQQRIRMDAVNKDDKDVLLVVIDYSIGISTTIAIH